MDIFEEVGRVATGRKGGQDKIYRLRQEKLDSIKASMAQEYEAMKLLQTAASAKESQYVITTPLSLRVAQDFLTRKFDSSDNKAEVFELAQIRLETARAEVNAILDRLPPGNETAEPLRAHLEAVELMNERRAKELDNNSQSVSSLQRSPLSTAQQITEAIGTIKHSQRVADSLRKHGESETACAVLDAALDTATEVAERVMVAH